MSSNMLDAAFHYAALGWSIIPTTPNSKRAAVKWKRCQDRKPDEAQLRDWFGNGQDVGLAVILGNVSGGLVCRDFDKMDAYEEWAAAYPELAKMLPTVATARGRHVYFRAADADLRFFNLPDGEYRGDSGHYCLLPPSQHPDGPVYTWLVPMPDGSIPFVADVCAASACSPGPFTQRTQAMSCLCVLCPLRLLCPLCIRRQDRPATLTLELKK